MFKAQRVLAMHRCSTRTNAHRAKGADVRRWHVQKGLKKRLRIPITSQNVGFPCGVPEVAGKDASRRQFKEE